MNRKKRKRQIILAVQQQRPRHQALRSFNATVVEKEGPTVTYLAAILRREKC